MSSAFLKGPQPQGGSVGIREIPIKVSFLKQRKYNNLGAGLAGWYLLKRLFLEKPGYKFIGKNLQ